MHDRISLPVHDTFSAISLFSDSDSWDAAVIAAYNLPRIVLEGPDLRVRLFASTPIFGRSVLATAPYATDGGISLKGPVPRECLLTDLERIFTQFRPRYILLKSRDKLFDVLPHHMALDNQYYSLVLDLSQGPENLWNHSIAPSVRRNIRKGLSFSPEIATGGKELINDFYSVASRCWRDLGSPTHSKRFFAEIMNHFGDNARILVLRHDRKPVSAALLLTSGMTIHHPYPYTIKQYNPYSFNSVLWWKIIELACRSGYKTFDMGRSRLGQGTFAFKKTWGAVPVPLYYYYYHHNESNVPQPDRLLIKAAVSLWKRLPLCLANIGGPYLIRNVL